MSLGLGAYGGFSRGATDRWAAAQRIDRISANARRIINSAARPVAGQQPVHPHSEYRGYRRGYGASGGHQRRPAHRLSPGG